MEFSAQSGFPQDLTGCEFSKEVTPLAFLMVEGKNGRDDGATPSKMQWERITLWTQRPVSLHPRLAGALPGTRANTPAHSPCSPWRLPTWHSRKPKLATLLVVST
jgi:hypothetical protein